MAKQKTQYKRNPRLARKFAEHNKKGRAYTERRNAWLALLSGNPSATIVENVADLLARLNFVPDAEGCPLGEWPALPQMDTLVFLDALAEGVYDNERREDTLEWKADILSVASLIWAGAITEETDKVKEIYPKARWLTAWFLSQHTDLERFWGRPGVGKTKADIRAKWENGEIIIFTKQLQDTLRRARGGTY